MPSRPRPPAPVDHNGRTIGVNCSGYGNGSTDTPAPYPYPCPTIYVLDEQSAT
ncbi:hypothetical protein [Streptomyces sp. NBC_00439]|uniref:hypothetical protein n=1 Tax=Streptomyces sp. NBC_00439 TaxID=2903650 RepID=UPI002258CE61|nr:hypothetical protein [Streptomyces sp. NBC_00439]MCX5103439.1 hypothetical protein [Streptomyces sp. NBC_00439]